MNNEICRYNKLNIAFLNGTRTCIYIYICIYLCRHPYLLDFVTYTCSYKYIVALAIDPQNVHDHDCKICLIGCV